MGNNLDARYTNGQETNRGSAGRHCRMKAGMRLQRGLIRLFLWFAQPANPQSAFTSVQEDDNKKNLGGAEREKWKHQTESWRSNPTRQMECFMST